MRRSERLLRSMGQLRRVSVTLLLGAMISLPLAETSNSSSQAVILAPPAEQERSAGWDQVAVASMLFRYYGLPAVNPSAYQCGVLAAIMRGREAEDCRESCAGCRFEARSTETLESLLQRYPNLVVKQFGGSPSQLHATIHREALPVWGVKSQLSKGRPVIALLEAEDQSRSVLVAGLREFDRKIDLLLVDPTEAGEQQLRTLGAIEAEGGLGWWLPYPSVVQLLSWKQTITVSTEGAITLPPPGAPPTQPPVAPPPVAVPRVQKCCVQSMYGPASCPLIGGPYQVGWSCHCQLGGDKRVVTGAVCTTN